LKRVSHETAWTQVGRNAEMVGWTDCYLARCPYPLTVGLERFHTPQGLKYAVLIRHQEAGTAVSPDLRAWFAEYNQRGDVEAGIKQSKTVFHIQHPLSRSRVGMQIQVALTLFAANFVGWARAWLVERLQTARLGQETRFQQVKILARQAANSAAWVEW